MTLAVSKNIKENGTIFAFEPSKVNLKFLRYHISCNKLQNIQVVDRLVSSSENSKSTFYESKEASGMNSVISLNNKDISQKKIMINNIIMFCNQITFI